MTRKKEKIPQKTSRSASDIIESKSYTHLLNGIGALLENARKTSVRAVNSIITSTYWKVGHQIVEFEQGGNIRAEYGERVLVRLADDLTSKYGRGFSERNLRQMRAFYLGWEIRQTPSAKLEARAKCRTIANESAIEKVQTLPALSDVLYNAFHLSWSHYVRLLAVENQQARAFYESEAIRGGWSVRQLDRQISTQFYERALASKDRDGMLVRGRRAKPDDRVSVEEEVRDPYLLEFLNLKDEYAENDLEEALVRHLEWFLLEMGTGFTFVARQKRIRVGNEWYRIDLLLYHRGLRCLVLIELKRGAFSHADAGQMNLYLNYAKEHLMLPGEEEPVGIILCGDKDDAVVEYATGGIRTKVFASKYMTILPDKETLRQEILKTQRLLEARHKEDTRNG